MTFGRPWWLLAGGLASMLILYLHLFRPRRRTVRVSSLYLWREIEREITLNRRRKRILTNLLLFLQILAVLLLAFGLADPRAGELLHGFEVAVVVDGSASMGLFEPGGTRFTLAKARIAEFMSQGEADRYSLWSAGNGELIYVGPSKSEMIAALDRLPPPAGTSDWETTLSRLASLHGESGRYHTVIATDGALSAERLAGLAAVGDEVSVIRVGTPHGNVGITEFAARAVGDDPFLHQVLIAVSNRSGSVQSATLLLESDRPLAAGDRARHTATLREAALSLAPNETQRIVFEHRFLPGEVLTARIGISDLFPADNQAVLVANPLDSLRVLVIGGASHLLRQGFEAFAHVRISEALNLPPPDVAAGFDVIVFYDRPVPEDFSGDAIAFVSGKSAEPGAGQAEITWWNSAHPLSRFVAWDEINTGPASPLTLAPGESALVETAEGPIVAVRSDLERRIVRVAIPLERSDFPFRVAYPVFLHNLIEWINPHAASLVPDPTPPGRLPPQARHALEQGGGPLTLYAFYDPAQRIEVDRADAIEISTFLARPGAYVWEANGRGGAFAVSLLDAQESDLTPRLGAWAAQGAVRLMTVESERLADKGRDYQGGAPSAGADSGAFGPWERAAALVALLVLAAEGLIFVRTHGPARAAPGPPVLTGAAAPGRRVRGPKGGGERDASAV